MKAAYTISKGLEEKGLEEFAAAREQFSYLVNELQGERTLCMEHGDVEEVIRQEGTELLRRLLQGHVDLRAARECKRDGVKGADGLMRRHCRVG